MNQRQWQTIEACVRKEQTKNVNNQPYYHELRAILDELYPLAHDGKPCLLYTSPSPRDQRGSRMPSSA